MNYTIFIIVLVLTSILGANAETFTISPPDVQVSQSGSVTVKEANLVKVMGRGIGTDRASALKDAYRDAVERAVGLFVDAEQMVKNDEIVSDKVLTQSNAYIEKCDIVKEVTENGVVKIKVLAVVKRRDLAKRISDTMPPQTYKLIDGCAVSAHANMVSEVKRSCDTFALVQNYFKDFNPFAQLMKVGLASITPQIINDPTHPDFVELAYPLKIEVDQKKYFEVTMPSLKRILDQISLTDPKTIRLTDGASRALVLDPYLRQFEINGFCKIFMSDSKYPSCATIWGWPLKGCFAGLHAYYGNVHGMSVGFSSRPVYWYMDFKKIDERIEARPCETKGSTLFNGDTKGEVLLFTAVNAAGAQAVLYTVDAAVVKIIAEWQKKIRTQTISYNIVFSDAKGTELGGGPWIFASSRGGCGDGREGCGLVMNSGLSERDKSWLIPGWEASCWMFTPFVHCWADQYLEWQKFTFKADDISKIASVSIELAE